MNIGDLVNTRPDNPLHCGSGKYPFAIVASVYPLMLVSESGDMIWYNVNSDGVYVVGEATPRMLRSVIKRLSRELIMKEENREF